MAEGYRRNEPPVLGGVHATKAFRFSPPSGRSNVLYVSQDGEALFFRLYDLRHATHYVFVYENDCASEVGHDNLPRADRATGPLLSSQAGVKGSTSTYGTCQQTILVKTITSML